MYSLRKAGETWEMLSSRGGETPHETPPLVKETGNGSVMFRMYSADHGCIYTHNIFTGLISTQMFFDHELKLCVWGFGRYDVLYTEASNICEYKSPKELLGLKKYVPHYASRVFTDYIRHIKIMLGDDLFPDYKPVPYSDVLIKNIKKYYEKRASHTGFHIDIQNMLERKMTPEWVYNTPRVSFDSARNALMSINNWEATLDDTWGACQWTQLW